MMALLGVKGLVWIVVGAMVLAGGWAFIAYQRELGREQVRAEIERAIGEARRAADEADRDFRRDGGSRGRLSEREF